MATDKGKRCLVLFSGGLDSTTLLALARKEGFEPIGLIFRYGQRHGVEVENAVRLAALLGVDHRIQDLDLRSIGGSALTSESMEVPQDRSEDEIGSRSIPPTYVPARNTIFLSFALAWAEVLETADLYIGVNALDYSGYPDCRPEYIDAFQRVANLASRSATEGGVRVRIHTPLIDKTKAQIIRLGVELGVDYSRTWSCYDPVYVTRERPVACGRCDSCFLRKKGFREAGVEDPTEYK